MTAGLWDPSHEREKVFFGGRLEKGTCLLGFPGSSTGKNPPAIRETRVRSLGREDPLEKG